MKEKQKLLDSWREMHVTLFDASTHDIPASSELCFSKLNKGGTMTDTLATQQGSSIPKLQSTLEKCANKKQLKTVLRSQK